MGLHCLPDRSTVFGKKLTSLLKPSFAWILSSMLKYFLNLWSFQTLFTFGIGPDILINVLEGCIVFLIWSAWALPNFHLKQKQEFSVWNFTENASFISFHGGILSRYSEINKFKTSIFKTSIFIFLEVTKTHHKMQVSKSTSCIMRLFASLNIHYNKNTKVQKQNETKVKKFQAKVVDSVIFGTHCNTFFQWTSRFPKFSVKISHGKT